MTAAVHGELPCGQSLRIGLRVSRRVVRASFRLAEHTAWHGRIVHAGTIRLHQIRCRKLESWVPFGQHDAMQKLTILPLLAFLGICTTSERASACDPVEPIHEYVTSTETDDSTPPILLAADISIMRAEDPGNRGGGCKEIGRYTIEVDASDDMTAAVDLGFALNLVDGNFPFAVPKGTVTGISNDGNFETWFVDQGGAFDGTLEVQVVDRGGMCLKPSRFRHPATRSAAVLVPAWA